MKLPYLGKFLLAAFLPLIATAQKQSEAPLLQEVKGYFQGYEVDINRKLQKDTLFFVDTKMRVYPGWFEHKIENDDYILIRYPDFAKGQKGDIGLTPVPVPAPDEKVYAGLWKYNRKTIAIKRTDFEKLEKTPIYGAGIGKKIKIEERTKTDEKTGVEKKIKIEKTKYSWIGFKVVSGQLTLPFKLRPAIKDQKFQMTTDVTIGGYAGFRQRLSTKQDIFLTIPATAGLSYININNNNTSTSLPANEKGDRIVPGVTWATGLLLQVNKFNAGFVIGKDYASQIAEDWIYHDRLWYSFAIGFSFSTRD